MGMNLPNGDLVQMAGAGIDRQGLLNFLNGKFATDDKEDDVVKSFEVFDREGNGLISNPELRHVLTGMGERLDPDQVEGMIQQADQGDGQVDYKRLVSILADNARRK